MRSTHRYPKPIFIALLMTALLPLFLKAGDAEVNRIDGELAQFLAREEMTKRFPQTRDCGTEITSQGSAPYITYTIYFNAPIPEGYWGGELRLNAQVDGKSGKV